MQMTRHWIAVLVVLALVGLGPVTVAAAPSATSAQLRAAPLRAAPPAPTVSKQSGTVARWPDTIVCHVPERIPHTISGQPTGGRKLKPFTKVVRLTLAPASDGRYYYSDGPTRDPDETIGDWPPGAILGFNADGTPLGQPSATGND